MLMGFEQIYSYCTKKYASYSHQSKIHYSRINFTFKNLTGLNQNIMKIVIFKVFQKIKYKSRNTKKQTDNTKNFFGRHFKRIIGRGKNDVNNQNRTLSRKYQPQVKDLGGGIIQEHGKRHLRLD